MLSEVDNGGRFLSILVFMDTNKYRLGDYPIFWDDFKTIVDFLVQEKNDDKEDEDIPVRKTYSTFSSHFFI